MQRLEFLSNISLFQGLTDLQLIEISQNITELFFDEGQCIVKDSDPSKTMCILRSGKVKLSKYSINGKEQTIHIYNSGELMGLCTLFTNNPFPANALALEKSCVYVISKALLEKMTYSDPSVMLNLVFGLSNRLNESMNMIESLSLQKLPQRLASFLLFSKKDNETKKIHLPFSHLELAKILGTTPESISRSFTSMKNKGIISLENRDIDILKIEDLKDMIDK